MEEIRVHGFYERTRDMIYYIIDFLIHFIFFLYLQKDEMSIYD